MAEENKPEGSEEDAILEYERTLKKGKKGSWAFILLLLLLVGGGGGFYAYDKVLNAPKATVKFKETINTQKLGNTFTFDVTAESTSSFSKEYTVNAEISSADGGKIWNETKILNFLSNEKKDIHYETRIADPSLPGKYNALVFLTAKKSVMSSEIARVAEDKCEFEVARKIVKGNLSDLKAKAAGKIKAGEKIAISVSVVNNGELPHEFPVTISVKSADGKTEELPVKKVNLDLRKIGIIKAEYTVPEAAAPGAYEVTAGLGKELDIENKLVEKYDEKSVSFTVEPPIISGAVILDKIEGEKKFNESIKIKAKFSNSGEAKYEFAIKIEVIDPSGKTTEILNEKTEIAKADSIDKEAEFKVDPALSDGNFKVNASIWEKKGDDGVLVNKYGEDSASFKVVDQPPKVVMFVGVPPSTEGEEGFINVVVRDDKEIKTVRLLYKGAWMANQESVMMEKLSGTEKEATYKASTGIIKGVGILNYYIEVTDSKNQTTRSIESRSEIKKKSEQTNDEKEKDKNKKK